MNKPKTTPAGPLWPSVTPAKPKGKKTAAGTVKPAEIESGDELVICNDPPPSSTLGPRVSKYYAKFEGLRVGQCLSCSKESIRNRAQADAKSGVFADPPICQPAIVYPDNQDAQAVYEKEHERAVILLTE